MIRQGWDSKVLASVTSVIHAAPVSLLATPFYRKGNRAQGERAMHPKSQQLGKAGG